MQITKKAQKAAYELKLIQNNNVYDLAHQGQILTQILNYPNIEDAQLHEKGNKLGNLDLVSVQSEIEKQIKDQVVQPIKLCDCCGALINTQELSICTALEDVRIGIGTHLYFKTLVIQAFIFFLGFILYSIMPLYTNIQDSTLIQNKLCIFDGNCGLADIGMGVKLLNLTQENQKLLYIQSILGLIFVILWGIIILIRNDYFQRVEISLNENQISISNFTLMIQNVPKYYLIDDSFDRIQSKFKRYEQKQQSNLSYEIVNINVCKLLFKLKQKQQKQQQKLKKILENKRNIFRSWIQYRQQNLQFPQTYQIRQNTIIDYFNYQTKLEDKSTFNEVKLQQFSTIFVTMKYSKAYQQILQKNPQSTLWNCFKLCNNYTFPINNLIFKKAPEPNQIIWENKGYPQQLRIIKRILVYSLACLLLAISLGISLLFGYYKGQLGNVYLSICISIVITAINFAIELVLMRISDWEYDEYQTTKQTSIAIKISVSQILNSVAVPIVVSIITSQSILISGGLVTDIFFIGLLGLLPPIARFIDPFNIMLHFQRWYFINPNRRLKITQFQFNKLYANYQFDLGYQYAYIIKTSVFTAFFMSLQPVIAIFLPIGFILMYGTNKYKIYYRFCKTYYHSSTVSNFVNLILHFSLISFGLGQFYTMNIVGHVSNTYILNLITIIIGCFYLIIPWQNIYKRCITQPTSSDFNYYEKKPLLNTQYDRSNPLTRQRAVCQFQKYLQELQKKQVLPHQSKIILKSIQFENKKFQQRKNHQINIEENQNFNSQNNLF